MEKTGQENRAAQFAKAWAVLEKEKCRRDPAYWIKTYVKTADEHSSQGENPIKPFPYRPYVKPIVDEWLKNEILHIAKSRQMAMSWLACAMLLWESQFNAYRLSVVINKAEGDSIKGIDRAKLMYNHQPVWLKNLCPLERKMKDQPRESLSFLNGSKLVALPQGAEKVRGMVPYTAMLDEAAYQDQLEATYAACIPCCERIVTISSAGPGFFQKLCTEG